MAQALFSYSTSNTDSCVHGFRHGPPESIISCFHRIEVIGEQGLQYLPYDARASDVIVYLRDNRSVLVLRLLLEKLGPPVLSDIEDEVRVVLKDIANCSEENGKDAIDTVVDNMTIGHYKFIVEYFVEDMKHGGVKLCFEKWYMTCLLV